MRKHNIIAGIFKLAVSHIIRLYLFFINSSANIKEAQTIEYILIIHYKNQLMTILILEG
jgi:hypothetical protein